MVMMSVLLDQHDPWIDMSHTLIILSNEEIFTQRREGGLCPQNQLAPLLFIEVHVLTQVERKVWERYNGNEMVMMSVLLDQHDLRMVWERYNGDEMVMMSVLLDQHDPWIDMSHTLIILSLFRAD
jgi:hypothetical protein